MENQAFYNSLLNGVNNNLNYREIQELKSFKKENAPLLETKIQKLKKNNRFGQIMMVSVLVLIVLFSFFLQLDIFPKLHRFFVILIMYFPVLLGSAIFGKTSLVKTQRKIDTFELMLILTKDEIPVKD
jgi:hypothetical protein